MGLPQLDFRVPEATWLKSAFVGKLTAKFGAMPGLSSTGALAWPYKIAVVAVMALVACGTLVTFGSAGAETPSSSEVATLPGTDEASPTVEGQVVPPSQALLNSQDLMSTLNFSDFSPADGDTTNFSLSDSDNSDNSDSDNKTTSSTTKKSTTKKSTPTSKPTPAKTSAPAPEPSKTTAPAPEPSKTTAPAPEPTKTSEPDPEPTTKCTVVMHLQKKC